ncbi:VanZ family protein [uncultured Rummeliibacillus sp.]|uniref:VanZ family protein n=1 Tax=uncultured Rummeliibacillus sp. TaxID=762292 RepID=UPI002603449B|nr:VanZ family protein [uncultured Rummeliibacillus sp.]
MKKFIPLIILLLVIFISSSQTYEQQSIVPTLETHFPSEPLEPLLSKLHFHYYGMEISVETRGYYYFLEFLIRKAAHFVTFGAIGIAILLALSNFKQRILISILMSFLFAIMDETHQYFTSGRSASFQDVLLDTSGAITFIVIFIFIRKLIRKKPTKA